MVRLASEDMIDKLSFNFDLRKATQALTFLAHKEGRPMNKMKALKLLYLADRYHLRKYGRLITNDIYFAMNYGPVLSSTKDLAEASSFLSDAEREYSSRYLRPVDPLTYEAIAETDKDMFSDSDLEALTYVWERFGRFDQFQLADITHVFPEWSRHKSALKVDSRIQMDLADFLEDSGTDFDRHFSISREDRDVLREALREKCQIESLWK